MTFEILTGGKHHRQLVKAEANLLRLPIFSLYAQDLKDLDGFECRGRITLNGQVYQYRFAVSRNSRTLYPGPMARSAHLAFLSIITEHGLPTQNPISWTWRDLCRRMDIECSGRTVQRLKKAIRSTAGLMLHSEDALYSKSEQGPVRTGETALHLYEQVVFMNERMPGGGMADSNFLWMSEWYLRNLNSLFTAPLDYELWRHLNRKSPIASRLYEFLLLKFYSGVPAFRMNYENLAHLLPLRPERFESQARRQLDPHIKTLIEAQILAPDSTWTKGKEGLQLHLSRGQRLLPAQGQELVTPELSLEEMAEELEVQELRNVRLPEWDLVVDFYKLWAGDLRARPTPKELEQARQLLQDHGPAKAAAIMQGIVKQLKAKWPDAKSFGAVTRYIPAALSEYDAQLQRQELARQETERRRQEEAERTRHKERDQQLAVLWDNLPIQEQEAIETHILSQNPILKRGSHFLRMLCLAELASRLEQESGGSA